MSTFARLLPAVFASVLCACGAGESDPAPAPAPEAEGTAQEPLYGSLAVQSSCDGSRATLIRYAWERGKKLARTLDYDACVTANLMQSYMPCAADPWPNSGRSFFNLIRALGAAHTLNTVIVGCSDDHPDAAGFTEAGSYGHTDSEQLKFVNNFLERRLSNGRDRWDESVVAGVLWHEVAHTHGYFHSQGSRNCGYPDDAASVHTYSVPGINGECVSQVAARYMIFANGPNGGRNFAPGRYGATIDNLTPLGNDSAEYFFIAPGMKVVYCSDQAAWDLVPYGYSSCTENSYWMDLDPQRYATHYWPVAPEVNGVSYLEIRPELIAFNTQYYGGAAEAFDVGTHSGWNLGRFASEMIGSLYVPAGIAATICRTSGACTTYTTPTSELWLGNVSSITVEPRVVLYSDRDFFGTAQSFRPGRHEGQLGQLASVGNNRALSLLVHPDLRVTLCDKEPSLGPSICKEFVSSVQDLSPVQLGNVVSYAHVRSVWEPSCGDGVCSAHESCSSCPSECPCASCGDGRCELDETCSSCRSDCGACTTCGNDVCGPGETWTNCPADCEPPACFVAGTAITMADGRTVPIERIREGDLVLSYDESAGLNVTGRVTRTFVHPDTRGLVELNGITTTREHRFFSAGRWVRADQLGPGAALQDPSGATPAVAVLTSLSRHATTYNFEVARTHTYYAGGFLVHNMKPE
jgi:hypothetical protein